MMPHKKVCYLAGPMTGYENFNREAFNSKASTLTEMGYNVLNPATLPNGLTQAQYMSICLPMVMASSHVYMLKGWKESEGAVAEHTLSSKLELVHFYE